MIRKSCRAVGGSAADPGVGVESTAGRDEGMAAAPGFTDGPPPETDNVGAAGNGKLRAEDILHSRDLGPGM